MKRISRLERVVRAMKAIGLGTTTDIARAANLDRASVHNLALTLERRRLVERVGAIPRHGAYSPVWRLKTVIRGGPTR